MSKGIGYELELMVDSLGPGLTYVRSKDIPGLHLVGKSFKSMQPIIEKAIKTLFLDNYKKPVKVIFLAEAAEFPKPKSLPSKVAVYQEAA